MAVSITIPGITIIKLTEDNQGKRLNDSNKKTEKHQCSNALTKSFQLQRLTQDENPGLYLKP